MLRHSAITNRVKDYNDKVGVFKDLTHEAARIAISKWANSGGSRGEDAVDRYSWVPMRDHALDDIANNEDDDGGYELSASAVSHISPTI